MAPSHRIYQKTFDLKCSGCREFVFVPISHNFFCDNRLEKVRKAATESYFWNLEDSEGADVSENGCQFASGGKELGIFGVVDSDLSIDRIHRRYVVGGWDTGAMLNFFTLKNCLPQILIITAKTIITLMKTGC